MTLRAFGEMGGCTLIHTHTHTPLPALSQRRSDKQTQPLYIGSLTHIGWQLGIVVVVVFVAFVVIAFVAVLVLVVGCRSRTATCNLFELQFDLH